MNKPIVQLGRSLKPTLAAVALIVLAWLGTGRLSAQPSVDEQPVNVGFRKQLFVDDYIVSSKSNVARELGTVVKANGGKPLLVADRPWENADLLRLGSVFRDDDRFRMWYMMNNGLCGYAESHDGLHWTKPNLGTHEYQGSTENNITDPIGFSCFLDAHETDPRHTYKSAYGHSTKIMACLAHSPDGFRWTPYNDGKPVTGRAADTSNQLLWDEDAKVYRLYTRTDYGRGLYSGTLEEDRGTRDMTNPDVKANPTGWKTVREWHFDREGRWEYKRRQVYSLNGWFHEGIHFGLLWCYEWAGAMGEGPYDLRKRHERDVLNSYILTTRGDRMWDLSWVYAKKPLIPRGPDDSFDKDWLHTAPNIVTWKDRHWIYFSGSKERHDIYRTREGLTRWQCAIGLATLGLDRFVGLEAKEAPGIVVTRPFELAGSRLKVNVDARSGSLAAEVLDAHGRAIAGLSRAECKPLENVDGFRRQLTWERQADFSALQGKLVRLKFSLRNAKLYAFQVCP